MARDVHGFTALGTCDEMRELGFGIMKAVRLGHRPHHNENEPEKLVSIGVSGPKSVNIGVHLRYYRISTPKLVVAGQLTSAAAPVNCAV